MSRTSLLIAVAAVLVPVGGWGQDVCGLVTAEQVKGVVGSAVGAGQAGVAKESNECTWSDARGEDRVYVAVRPGAEFGAIRARIVKAGGHPAAVAGVGEDAFFVASEESTTALYVLGKGHLVLVTVNLPDGTQQSNEAAEKVLVGEILAKL